jgi:hypothetical protein
VFATLLLLVGDASLDTRRVWQEIRPQEGPVQQVSIDCDVCRIVKLNRVFLHSGSQRSSSRTVSCRRVEDRPRNENIALPLS